VQQDKVTPTKRKGDFRYIRRNGMNSIIRPALYVALPHRHLRAGKNETMRAALFGRSAKGDVLAMCAIARPRGDVLRSIRRRLRSRHELDLHMRQPARE
jgi:diaminopimelate decarboxylase